MPAPTPTLIQDVASSANPVGLGIEGNNFKIPLPNSVGAGNALILALTYPHGSNPTITDSNGNTWSATAAVSADAGEGGNISAIWVLPNAHAGQTTITVSFAEPVIPFNYALSEFDNVDTVNPINGTSATADDSGASLSTGSFTPGNNDAGGGNLVYNYYAISGAANGDPTSWTSGSNFTLLDADIAWNKNQGFPHASQYFVQTTAAPINPSITATGDSADGFNGVAVALRAAPAGTPAPTGIHINKIIHQTTNAAPDTTSHLQVPTTGNLLVLGTAQANNVINITSITDSDGGVWTKIEPSDDEPQIWYSANRSPNPNLMVTIHYGDYTSGTPTMTALFYDISGAAADPFDVAAGSVYTDISNQTTIDDFPLITPTTANGLVIAVMGDGQGPGLGLNTGSPSGAIFDLVTYAGETDLDLMENADGQAHLYNTTTATEHWNWRITANSNNGASATAVAFKAATTTGSPMPVYTHNEVANSPTTYWSDVDITTLGTVTSTKVAATNTDGTLTILIGTGFTMSGGALTGGTVTSMQRTDASQTVVYETITGLSYPATALQGHLAESNLEGVAADIFSGADAFNGYSGNDVLRGFSGSDIFSGGAGSDAIDGGGGSDTAVYSGTHTQYLINQFADGSVRLIDQRGGSPDGTDTDSNIELYQFSDGTFTLSQLIGAGPGNDFNGDGMSDVLWRHGDGSIRDWLMNGTAISGGDVFTWRSNNWTVEATGDANGDGRDDIFWRHADGTVGTTWVDGTSVVGDGNLTWQSSAWNLQGVGDLNADGRDDILWRHTDGSLMASLVNGNTVTSNTIYGWLSSSWTLQGVGDVNGDLKDDLVWRHTDGTVALMTMNGGSIAGFSNVGWMSSAWSVQGIGDLNGDGRDDILWRHTDGSLAAWLMNGTTISNSSVFGWMSNTWAVQELGDMNGDNRDDVLWRHADGTVAEWQMNGAGIAATSTIGWLSNDWFIG